VLGAGRRSEEDVRLTLFLIFFSSHLTKGVLHWRMNSEDETLLTTHYVSKAISAFESSCQHLSAAMFGPPAVEGTGAEGSPVAHPEPLMPSGSAKLLFSLLRSLLRGYKRDLSYCVERSTNKSHQEKEWRVIFRLSLH